MPEPRRRKLVNQGRIPIKQAETEEIVSLKQATNLFSVKVSVDDLFNWRSRGVPVVVGRKRRVVYLGWFRQASRVYTTKEAIRRFILATNGE